MPDRRPTGKRNYGAVAACILAALSTLGSCGTNAVRRPESRVEQTVPASLIAFVREPSGKPVEGCKVVIEPARIGGMTDSEGRARIVRIPAGAWAVSWRITGGFGDSTRMVFVAGREETLNAIVRFEARETWSPSERRQR